MDHLMVSRRRAMSVAMAIISALLLSNFNIRVVVVDVDCGVFVVDGSGVRRSE